MGWFLCLVGVRSLPPEAGKLCCFVRDDERWWKEILRLVLLAQNDGGEVGSLHSLRSVEMTSGGEEAVVLE